MSDFNSLIRDIYRWLDPDTFDWWRTLLLVGAIAIVISIFSALRRFAEIPFGDLGNDSEICWDDDAGHHRPSDED